MSKLKKPGPWIRPVSSRHTREISLLERSYGDGTDSEVLDIIRMRLLRPLPSDAQPENWLIDENKRWKKVGRVEFDELDPWLDDPDSLWDNGESSYYGLNNRIRNISPEQKDRLGLEEDTEASLYLIPVSLLSLTVGPKAPEFGNMDRAIRGEFEYKNVQYRLDMTDPFIERQYREDGEYKIKRPALCISRAEPYKEFSYKLIAAILHKGRF